MNKSSTASFCWQPNFLSKWLLLQHPNFIFQQLLLAPFTPPGFTCCFFSLQSKQLKQQAVSLHWFMWDDGKIRSFYPEEHEVIPPAPWWERDVPHRCWNLAELKSSHFCPMKNGCFKKWRAKPKPSKPKPSTYSRIFLLKIRGPQCVFFWDVGILEQSSNEFKLPDGTTKPLLASNGKPGDKSAGSAPVAPNVLPSETGYNITIKWLINGWFRLWLLSMLGTYVFFFWNCEKTHPNMGLEVLVDFGPSIC